MSPPPVASTGPQLWDSNVRVHTFCRVVMSQAWISPMWSAPCTTVRPMSLISEPSHSLPGSYFCAVPRSEPHRLSFAGMYRYPVFGLYAAGTQSFPPHSEGQNATFLPMTGFLVSSYVGLPVRGSMLLNAVWLT